MQIWLKKSENMVEAGKEARKKQQQELLTELKLLMAEAGVFARFNHEGHIDGCSVLRHTIRLLRDHPAALGNSPDPLDLSTHSNTSSSQSLGPLPPPMEVMEVGAAGEGGGGPEELRLLLALPDCVVREADGAAHLSAAAKEMEGRRLLSVLSAADGILLSSAVLRLANGAPPLLLHLRLGPKPLRVVCSASEDRQSIILSCRPLQVPKEPSFSTRLGPELRLSSVDGAPEALGRLPQELLGTSLLTLLHRDDGPALIKTLREAALAPGEKTRPSPLRFLLPGGSFARAQSEWTAALNPWTKKLESLSGLHRVTAEEVGGVALSEAEVSVLEADWGRALAKPRETEPKAFSPLREALSTSPKRRKSGRDLSVFLDDLILQAYRDSAPNITIPANHNGEEEAGGCSPPDGPLSYGFLNTYEKVHRLLSSSAGLGVSPSPPIPPAHAEPLRLTKELLAQHTQKLAREHRETWRRKYSGDMGSDLKAGAAPTPAPTPAEPMATLKRALEAQPPPQITPPKQPKVEVSEASVRAWKPSPEYYRPNPPPPPGRNVQITSLPLAHASLASGSAAASLAQLSAQRQAAEAAAPFRPALAPPHWSLPTPQIRPASVIRPHVSRAEELHWAPAPIPAPTPWAPQQNSAVKEATDALMLLQET